MREAWRLQKQAVYAVIPPASQVHVFLIYTGPTDKVPDHALITAAVNTCISQLVEKIPADA